MVGTKVGCIFTSDFSQDFTGTFGNKTNYTGLELVISLSVLWGKGRLPD